MQIGVMGSGNVGGTLGKCLAENGHTVLFSTRNAGSEKMRTLLGEAGSNARATSMQETVRNSDVLLLATPWDATEEILKGAGNLSGKILIDVVNPLLPDLSGIALPNTTSGAELVAQWGRGARVVKAFNTVGFNVMANSHFPDGPAVMFYCGDDGEAKKVVAGLISELGFEAVDAGPLTRARLLEPFALLWISLAIQQGLGRDIAFRLLRR